MILVALLACGPAQDSALCVQDPPVDYATFGQGFLLKHCTGCHSSEMTGDARQGAPVGVDLDSEQAASDLADRIHARVLVPEVPEMPPGGGPDADELELLAVWLACQEGVP